MFDQLLPKNINAYAVTASNPDESSYACYWDDTRGTYLGDVFSVNWMEDSDKENLQKESLKQQYVIVRKETNTSHVMQYGDLGFDPLKVSQFMGAKNPRRTFAPKASKADAVSQKEVYMRVLRSKVENAASDEEKSYWVDQIEIAEKKREFVTGVIHTIAETVAKDSAHLKLILRTRRNHPISKEAHVCLAEANKYFSRQCFSYAKNEFALFSAPRILANACMNEVTSDELILAMDSICTHQIMTGIN